MRAVASTRAVRSTPIGGSSSCGKNRSRIAIDIVAHDRRERLARLEHARVLPASDEGQLRRARTVDRVQALDDLRAVEAFGQLEPRIDERRERGDGASGIGRDGSRAVSHSSTPSTRRS